MHRLLEVPRASVISSVMVAGTGSRRALSAMRQMCSQPPCAAVMGSAGFSRYAAVIAFSAVAICSYSPPIRYFQFRLKLHNARLGDELVRGSVDRHLRICPFCRLVRRIRVAFQFRVEL